MGYVGVSKEVVGASLEKSVADYLHARGKRLDKSKSWAVGKIVDYWIAQGAPALSEADAALPELSFEKFKAEREKHPVKQHPEIINQPKIHHPKASPKRKAL